jgi:hypothetical protein
MAAVTEYAQGGYIPSDATLPDSLLGDPGFLLTAEQAKRLRARLLDQLNEAPRSEEEDVT